MADYTLHQTVECVDGWRVLRLTLPAGALGELGHDRFDFFSPHRPVVSFIHQIMADIGARRRGEPMPSTVRMKFTGLLELSFETGDELLITLKLSPRWAAHSTTSCWRYVVGKMVSVEAADGEEHPTWSRLAELSWDDVRESAEVAA